MEGRDPAALLDNFNPGDEKEEARNATIALKILTSEDPELLQNIAALLSAHPLELAPHTYWGEVGQEIQYPNRPKPGLSGILARFEDHDVCHCVRW